MSTDLSIRKHPSAACEKCPLRSVGQFVPSKWVEGSNVVFVGEAPGADEVQAQEPFVGISGKLLGRALTSVGVDPATISKANVVACRPPNNDLKAYSGAIRCCLPRLYRELESFPGDKVVTLGKISTEAVLGSLAKRNDVVDMGVTARRGRWFDPAPEGRLHGKKFLSEYHPAYVSRKPSEMLGFKKGIARVFSNASGSLLDPPEVIYLDSYERLRDKLSVVPKDTWTAFDLETNQVQWFDRPDEPADGILMLGMAWNLKRGYVVPGELLYDDYRIRRLLNDFFKHIRTIAHNGKFDVVFLKTVGVQAKVDFDTMLAHFVLEETSPHGLKIIAQNEYGLPDYEAEIISKYLKSSNDWYSKIPFDQLSLYGVWDVVVTRALMPRFEKRLRARPAFSGEFLEICTREEICGASLYEWPFMNLLMPAQHFLSDVEYKGIGVDVPYLKRAKEAMDEEIKERTNILRRLSNRPDLNPNASGQIADVLYVDRELPRPKQLARILGRRVSKAKSKNPENVADKGTLDAIIEATDDVFAKEVKKYRRVKKIQSSYIENMLDYADTNGCVHADYRVMGTEVGRLAVRDPALQTVPRASDRYGATIRGAFIAHPFTVEELAYYCQGGPLPWQFWEWLDITPPEHLDPSDDAAQALLSISDYSQAELRCAAHYSKEPFLIKVYEDDRDLHDEGCNSMFGTPEQIMKSEGGSEEEAYVIWKEKRVEVKMFNFAYLYGGNENSFAQDRGIPMHQAKAFVKRYEANMPRLAAWRKEQYKLALRHGYVTTVHGRRRSFPELGALTPDTMWMPENKQLLDDVRKAAVHAVVAGTASDLCLLSASVLANKGLQIVLLVHDSILCRVPAFISNRVSELVPAQMVETASYWLPRVRWKADTKVTTRWAKPPADLIS